MNLYQLLDLDFKKFERDTNVKLKSVLSNMTAPSAEKSRSRTKSKPKSNSIKKDFIKMVNQDKKASNYHLDVDHKEKVGKNESWKGIVIQKKLLSNITDEPKSGKKKAK